MKIIALTTAAATLLVGTTALAGPVEDAIARLAAEGYTVTEVERKGGRTEIEARKDGMEREIVLAASGEVIQDYTEAEDHDDHDDDDRDGHDDDDSGDRDDS